MSSLLLLLMLLSTPTNLTQCEQISPEVQDSHPMAVKVFVRGEAREGQLSIMTELGEGVTRALRVYSEPSGTLLAVFMNSDVPEPVNRAWLDSVTAESEVAVSDVAVASVPFSPGVRARVYTNTAPTTDTRIKLLIHGSWPDEDGVMREQNIPIRVATNVADFAFTYRRRLRFEPEVTRPFDRPYRKLVAYGQICCGTGSGPCGQACETCEGNDYCCGYVTDPTCGWCARNTAGCHLFCDPC